jgi:hypothetical protein
MKKLFVCLIALLLLCATPVGSMDVTLQWDENTEPELMGYAVYYDIDGDTEPWNGTGATEGNCPIIILLGDDENPDPQFFEYTLHNLAEKRTYFRVKAYDNEGLYSGYSNSCDTGVSTPTGMHCIKH